MDLDEYQKLAQETDQNPKQRSINDLVIPMLGLAGESGGLLSEFKKRVRDRKAYGGFDGRIEEELGDILWYLSNIASRLGFSLNKIAAGNLIKVQERWPLPDEQREKAALYDSIYPSDEQFPRSLTIKIHEPEPDRTARMVISPGDVQIGGTLTDNARHDDGYRFHDSLHLGHLAVLGWSPVMRALLGRKRKSDRRVDEIEDGARAILLEEAIVAITYSKASEFSFFEGVRSVDTEMLGTISRLTSHLEVSSKKPKDWERAILEGYRLFRKLQSQGSATVKIDLNANRMTISD